MYTLIYNKQDRFPGEPVNNMEVYSHVSSQMGSRDYFKLKIYLYHGGIDFLKYSEQW